MELSTNVKTGDLKITEGATPTPPVIGEVKKEPDLITRVAQHKPEEIKPEVKPTGISEPEFDFKDIEKIADPAAKDYAMKAYKSFQKGFNQKFQEIADIRKSLESKQQETTAWTPDKVQGLLKDPQFLTAAQQVAATQAPSGFEGSQEQWSALSDGDKTKFQMLENKINLLEQQNFQTMKVSQDEQLRNKYPNYNPEAIDILTADLLQGKVQATREHLWKVYDYDEAVRRAYQLGKEDRQLDTKEKVSSTSVEGITTTSSKEKPTPEKGESNRAFWDRVVLSNLTKLKEGQLRK
jgi:hypothetical protein